MINIKNNIKRATVFYADKKDDILESLKNLFSGKQIDYNFYHGSHRYYLNSINCDMEFECVSGLYSYPKLLDAFEDFLLNKRELIEEAIKIENNWTSISQYEKAMNKLAIKFRDNGIKNLHRIYEDIEKMDMNSLSKFKTGQMDILIDKKDKQFLRIKSYAKANRELWLKLRNAVNKEKIGSLSVSERDDYFEINERTFRSRALVVFGSNIIIIVNGILHVSEDDDRTGVTFVDVMK